jgi:NAD(P)H-nitrite reductase large subunit
MTGKSSPAGAILQRDRRTYAIVSHIPGGLLDFEILPKCSTVVEKYQIPIAKITSGQRTGLETFKQSI